MAVGKVKVFYDGLCRVCSSEMDRFRRHDKSQRLEFIDITDKKFKAEDYGLDPQKLNEAMHVIDLKGQVHAGVDGFMVIWDQYDLLRPWIKVVKHPWLLPLFKKGYWIFATKIRPILPKKHKCDSDHCHMKNP